MHIKDSTVLSMEIFGALAEEDKKKDETNDRDREIIS